MPWQLLAERSLAGGYKETARQGWHTLILQGWIRGFGETSINSVVSNCASLLFLTILFFKLWVLTAFSLHQQLTHQPKIDSSFVNFLVVVSWVRQLLSSVCFCREHQQNEESDRLLMIRKMKWMQRASQTPSRSYRSDPNIPEKIIEACSKCMRYLYGISKITQRLGCENQTQLIAWAYASQREKSLSWSHMI